MKDNYGNPPVIITENGEQCQSSKLNIDFHKITWFKLMSAGMDDPNRGSIPLEKALQDDKRINFHRDYLTNLSAAIR